MKKLAVVFLFISTIGLSGCGNQQLFDTTWNFNRAIIVVGTKSYEVEVQSWKDFENSDMIQVRTRDGKTYLTHSSNVLLIQE